jgi:hypothetical protein
MQHQKRKKANSKKSKKKKYNSSYRSEYNGYQPDSPLTGHYLKTGAVLPEGKD